MLICTTKPKVIINRAMVYFSLVRFTSQRSQGARIIARSARKILKTHGAETTLSNRTL